MMQVCQNVILEYKIKPSMRLSFVSRDMEMQPFIYHTWPPPKLIPHVIEQMEIACPCVVIKKSAYSLLVDYVKSTHARTATITFKETTLKVKPPPLATNYASREPSRYLPTNLEA